MTLIDQLIAFANTDLAKILGGLVIGIGGLPLLALRKKLKVAEKIIVAVNLGLDEYANSSTVDHNIVAKHLARKAVSENLDLKIMDEIIVREKLKQAKKNGKRRGR